MKAPSHIKLLILNHTSKIGGGERALLEFLRRLAGDVNLKIIVALPDSAGPLYVELLKFPEIEVVVIPAPQRLTLMKKANYGSSIIRQPAVVLSFLRLTWAIRRFIRANQIQVVLTNSIKADIYGTMASALAWRPIVWFLHDNIDGHYFPASLQWLLALLANWRVRKVVCNSNATREAFNRIGARSSVLATVYPPPVTWPGNGGARHQSIREEIKLPVDCPLIGLVGRITPPKGQMEFVKAAHIVAETFPEARYLIVGDSLFGTYDDEYKASLQALVARSPIKGKIHLLGMRTDVLKILSDLDLLVCASQWPEGFGLTIAEGMVLGKPVVSTIAGGTVELVQHGKTGLLVPTGDGPSLANAIIALLNAPRMAKQMGTAGKQRIAGILREANCDALKSILVEAAAR